VLFLVTGTGLGHDCVEPREAFALVTAGLVRGDRG